MWRYCRDSCPAASCIPAIVVSELRSYIKSLQLFQRLWLCRSYPCPNISVLSRNTIGVFVFFSAVFFKVLELTERESPKDFCYFVFHTFLELCNHSHSFRRIQLCVQVCWVAVSTCRAFRVACSNCQGTPKCCDIDFVPFCKGDHNTFLDCKSEVPGDFFRLWLFHLLQIWKSVSMMEDL